MKILQINSVYKNGSTGKIVADIHTELLKNGYESIVCYGNGADLKEKNVYKVSSKLFGKYNALRARITGVMYGGCVLPTKRLISVIKKEKPDVVHLHCLNGNFTNVYKLIDWLKKSGIKTVLTLHAELMHTANCGYALDCDRWKNGCGKCPRLKQETKSFFRDGTHLSWMKMKKAFEGFNDNLSVTSVSPWLMERAKQSPILADKNHTVVYNGLDTEIFKLYETADLRNKHCIKDEKIIFHATPSFNNDPSHIKGGYYVLKLAEKMKDKKVKFIVAGSYDESIKVPENMIMLGRVNNQIELAKYYSMADVTLLTSKKETFSMVCAESLCCGTPVVGFKAGAPEQISLKEYSEFVEQGDIDSLETAITKTFDKLIEKTKISAESIEVYSKKKMYERYVSTYNE